MMYTDRIAASERSLGSSCSSSGGMTETGPDRGPVQLWRTNQRGKREKCLLLSGEGDVHARIAGTARGDRRKVFCLDHRRCHRTARGDRGEFRTQGEGEAQGQQHRGGESLQVHLVSPFWIFGGTR